MANVEKQKTKCLVSVERCLLAEDLKLPFHIHIFIVPQPNFQWQIPHYSIPKYYEVTQK